MHLLIDESNLFIFPEQQSKQWGTALVAGVLLPVRAREKFLKKYKSLTKEMRQNDTFVRKFIDDLIDWKVCGVVITGDTANVIKSDAERFRSYFLTPLYTFANNEPENLKTALLFHLDNLAGKGNTKFSLQDFIKTIVILETISALIQTFISNTSKMRRIDIKKVELIIDDQCEAAQTTLNRGFIHFFLNCRSKDGRFVIPERSGNFRELYTHKVCGKTFLDSTKLLSKILVGKQGDRMDDKHPELHIVDILANFSTKILKGEIPEADAKKLSQIITFQDNLHFHPDKEFLDLPIPQVNQNAISQFIQKK